jgi:hypothetical protein
MKAITAAGAVTHRPPLNRVLGGIDIVARVEAITSVIEP